MQVLFFAKGRSFPSGNHHQGLASEQPVEKWLQRLEDFGVKTSQFLRKEKSVYEESHPATNRRTLCQNSKAQLHLEPVDKANGWGREWQ